MNTFGMKVSCPVFIGYDSPEDLLDIDFGSLRPPVLNLGGGSNLLFERDFGGTVLHSSIDYIKELSRAGGSCLVEAGSGVVFDSFVQWCCSRGLWGAENLSMIPGVVGAAAVQNIGAYGAEVKDIIEEVRCFDVSRKCWCVLENKDCRYAYRDSFFKNEGKGRYIITSVLFLLSEKPWPRLGYGNLASLLEGKPDLTPSDVRDAVCALRESKLPDPGKIGSAGSFFKNPVVPEEHYRRIEAVAKSEFGPDAVVPHFIQADGIKVPAAWMIDRCGLKGSSVGGAALYEKQPLVIVNRSGEATPEDILELERIVVDAVRNKFGVELHPEVEHIK